jgi:hypothetical protein
MRPDADALVAASAQARCSSTRGGHVSHVRSPEDALC